MNPVEQALGDDLVDVKAKQLEAVKVVRNSKYAWLYQIVFPGVLYDNSRVTEAYDNIAKATSAVERSIAVNKFNSKFDKFVKEQGGDVGSFGIKEIDVKVINADTGLEEVINSGSTSGRPRASSPSTSLIRKRMAWRFSMRTPRMQLLTL